MTNDQYFPHDATASSNAKHMLLIEKLGMRGYGSYWMIVEYLRMQKDYTGNLNALPQLSRRIRVKPKLLLEVINNYDLFVVEGKLFYSSGLIARMLPLEHSRAMRTQRATHAAKSKHLNNSTNCSARAMQEEESKEEKSKGEKNNPLISPSERGGDSSLSLSLFPFDSYSPPSYALNKETHNYEGFVFELKRLGITSENEVRDLMALTDYGKKGTYFWKLLIEKLHDPTWKPAKGPGYYFIRALSAKIRADGKIANEKS